MFDLMRVFELYLAATFLLVLVQLRHHVQLYRVVLRAPQRWPRLVEVVRHDLPRLLTLPSVLVIGVGLGLWVSHALLLRLVWPDARVEPEDLVRRPSALALSVLSTALMVALDARAAIRAARFTPPRYTWLIDLTEWSLRADPSLVLGRIAAWRIRSRMARSLPLVRRWVAWRSLELGARITVGATLWWSWVAAA